MLEEEEEVKIQNAIAELQLNQREEIASLNKVGQLYWIAL